jgi:hypothetical protein
MNDLLKKAQLKLNKRFKQMNQVTSIMKNVNISQTRLPNCGSNDGSASKISISVLNEDNQDISQFDQTSFRTMDNKTVVPNIKY